MNEEVKVELKAFDKSLSTDPYACVTRTKHPTLSVGHIPSETSRCVYFFLKKELEKFLVH